MPDLAGATAAERLRQGPVDEAYFEPGATDDFGCRGVFSDFLAKRLDASGALEIFAPPQHRLALGEASAEAIDDILPARLIGIEESAFDLGPKSVRTGADRRRRDKAGVGAPTREQPLNVVARHQYVTVSDDDPVGATRRASP